MSTKFRPIRMDPAKGIFFAPARVSARRDQGVSRPVEPPTSPSPTDTHGPAPMPGVASSRPLSPAAAVEATAPGPGIGGISSAGANHDQ